MEHHGGRFPGPGRESFDNGTGQGVRRDSDGPPPGTDHGLGGGGPLEGHPPGPSQSPGYKRAPPPPDRKGLEGPPPKRPYDGAEEPEGYAGRGGHSARPFVPGGAGRGRADYAGEFHEMPPPHAAQGPPGDADYDSGYRGRAGGPTVGRGGYRGRGGHGDGPPPPEERPDDNGYVRGRGRGSYHGRPGRGYGRGDGGRAEWAEHGAPDHGDRYPPDGSPEGPPRSHEDRPNVQVYPPRDHEDTKPSFEVYPPRDGAPADGPPLPHDRPGPPDAPGQYGPPHAEGYDRGRGYYRSPRARGRPPFWRGRGRGESGYPPEGGDFEGGRGSGYADRGRGWVDRGRGWVDRGRGWVDRGRGGYDRGRGWVDRGRGGDRGRGWVDRGRGWVDRGRGWVDRGRGWVDRGRGWVDRGRGWVDRGRGWVDRGRGRGRGNIEFDKTGEYMWDEKNSCWKKVPQHWKMQENVDKGQYEGAGGQKEGGDAWRDWEAREEWRGEAWEARKEPWAAGEEAGGGGGGGGGRGEEQAVWEEDGWIWDEREQAWRTQRPDGGWEWEWEYEAREARAGGREGRGEKSVSASPQWRGDYKPQLDEAGRELPRAYAPVEAAEDSDDSSSDSDSSTDSELERHRAAERAMSKYRKASRKSRAFAEEIDKHRRKLLRVEEKLRRHKERKRRKKQKSRSDEKRTGRSPPRQYRQYEEGEVDISEEDDRELPEQSDIFHGPRLKYRDKGAQHGQYDPGGGCLPPAEGFRDVDYRFSEHNPFGDQDERRSGGGYAQEAQETQPQPWHWREEQRGRGRGVNRGSPRAQPLAPQALAPQAARQEEGVEEEAEARREYEFERVERGRRGQQELGGWRAPCRRGPARGARGSPWRDATPQREDPRRGADAWGRPEGRDEWEPPSSRAYPRERPREAYPREISEPAEGAWRDFGDDAASWSGRKPGAGHDRADVWRDPIRSSDRREADNSGRTRVKIEETEGDRGVTSGSRGADGFHSYSGDVTGLGNNKDYAEYADYFGLEDPMFTEASLEPAWVRSTPADLYFRRDKKSNNMVSTSKMRDIEDYFEQNLVLRATAVRESRPKYEKPNRNCPVILHSYSDSESGSDDDEIEDEINKEMVDEIERKKQHPERLHEDLWFNEQGESNTGPYCRCSLKARRTGIRHGIYPGDEPYPVCEPASNNWERLFHYRLSVSPVTNFLLKDPTVIEHDDHEYMFEGFSLFSHYRIGSNVPQCKVVRFNIEYTLHWIEEDPPQNYDIRSIDLFNDFLMEELLELYDLNLRDDDGGCRKFHFMPRFARPLPDNGKEILSMDNVLNYMIKSSKALITKEQLARLVDHSPHQWADFVDTIRGSVITCPGSRPSSLRIDQLDKENLSHDNLVFPKIVHFGMKPSRITYVGHPEYNKLWKQFVKFRHLLTYKPKVTPEDRAKVKAKEEQLQHLRLKKSLKREVTVALESEGWLKTGFNADVCQHALMLPVLISHLRFHKCLDHLEERLRYKFNNRQLLQFALTHPSYRYGTVNYGTNPDHARNSMFNCGMRQPEFGNKSDWIKVHRKRGINVLIKIMAKMAKKEEQASVIDNYERLEFLGDAVVEFITTVHLYFMLPDAPEGVLATYRSAIVQNQHLTELAKNLNLQDYFLFAHGPDLCHESEIRHALANCFEALMGAVFMDCGIEVADRIFGEAFFKDQPELLETWHNLPLHPLQEDEPNGDRHWISKSPPLQKLVHFEEATGLRFDHIRLLARAFTVRNVGYTSLTLGHNQRMEFLGDTVMQLVVSEYVFKHFPDHHEGHLSLLRQCLVNNKTQCLVCEDLAMEQYMITTTQRRQNDLANMKTKEKADLIEAFIGALYVDKGVEWVKVFLRVCFFPRLKEFIMLGDWNDPKSRLQQCCLLRRDPNEQEPEMPKYKVLESKGPTNTRVYRVAVYFKGNRLADAEGPSIQQAEMKAAQAALEKREELFPLLKYHKNFLKHKFKAFRTGELEMQEIFEEKIPEDEIVPFKEEKYLGTAKSESKTASGESKPEVAGVTSEATEAKPEVAEVKAEKSEPDAVDTTAPAIAAKT